MSVPKLTMVAFLVCVLSCSSPSPSVNDAAKSHADVAFEKKVQCQKYQKQLEDNLEQDQFRIESLYSVFYSSKRNSCLIAKYTLFPTKNKKETESETAEIDDILTKQQVWSRYYSVSKQYPEVEADLDVQITALQ